jgi:formate/nitrite transporter
MADYLTPAEIAQSVVESSKKKAALPLLPMIALGVLAGAYIGFGGELYTMIIHDLQKYVGVGLSRFFAGSGFSVGLMLCVICGAELFTGNCLMVVGLLARQITMKAMLRNWTIVYLANFAGALLMVVIIYYSDLWSYAGMVEIGGVALRAATRRVAMTFTEAFMRGIACNWLVCLAVWMALGAKDIVGKIFAIYFPIMAFVTSAFEHSIANMYLVPIGIILKNDAAVVNAAVTLEKVPVENITNLTWLNFFTNNLIPVTLGNIVGGALMVGMVYWFVYLRPQQTTGGKTAT